MFKKTTKSQCSRDQGTVTSDWAMKFKRSKSFKKRSKIENMN